MTLGARRPLPIAAVAAALVLVVAGCGESRDEESATTESAAPPATDTTKPPGVTVTETEFKLTPKDLSVPKTGKLTIAVRNEGKIEHALEVEGEGGAGEVETDPIAPGGSATLEFDFKEPGRYVWYCPIGDHEEQGMAGTIVVAGASTGAPEDVKGGDRKRKRDGDSDGAGDSGGRSPGTSGDDSGGGGKDSESGGAAPSDESRGGYSPG